MVTSKRALHACENFPPPLTTHILTTAGVQNVFSRKEALTSLTPSGGCMHIPNNHKPTMAGEGRVLRGVVGEAAKVELA